MIHFNLTHIQLLLIYLYLYWLKNDVKQLTYLLTHQNVSPSVDIRIDGLNFLQTCFTLFLKVCIIMGILNGINKVN